jgi:hypothetical protein
MKLTRGTPLLVAAVVAATAAAAPSPASAAAKPKNCPAQKGTIKVDGYKIGRVWHRGTKLFACTTVYGHAPKSRYLGPWAPGTKVAFDGVNLGWTVRTVAEGRSTDRVWAGSADTGKRWMLAQKPNPGGATKAAREVRVQRIVVADRGLAWVTQGGDVVGALESPASDPAPVGTFTTPPSVLQKRLVLIGSWPAVPAATLAATLKIVEEPGEGDECGGGNPYLITVRPDAAKPAIGVRWDGYWTSTNCD